MNSYIIGIDPGATGFFCRLNVNTFQTEFFPMPVEYRSYLYRDEKTGKKKERRYRVINTKELRKLVANLAQPNVLFFTIESQQAYPSKNGQQQGIASTARHLFSYGYLLCLLENTPVPVEQTRAASWKRKMGLCKKYKQGEPLTQYQKKCRAWEAACSLYPELKAELTPKSYNFDKAESLLMTHYGLNFLGKKYGLKDNADCLDEPAFL